MHGPCGAGGGPGRLSGIGPANRWKTAPPAGSDEYRHAASSAVPDRTHREGKTEMGTIRVHEFMSLDGVIDTPTWTFDYGYDPRMGQAIGELMSSCQAILLGRTTYQMFEPAWSTRTAEEDPGAPFMNDTTKYVVSSTLKNGDIWRNSEITGAYNADKIRA